MKYLLLFLGLTLSFTTLAQTSMRRCTLLPVTDGVGGAIGFKVFEEVENDLRRSSWCSYVSNSEMINIFSRYRENLPQYLKTKEVLKTVSEKLKAGSLVLVNLKNEIDGVEVEITVFGENGEDIYFNEKTLLNSDEIEKISRLVQNWLQMYSKMIPYDAQINGILGDQVTMDVDKSFPVQAGQRFIVKRPVNKKKHPLLKKIVDWETRTVAEGKVFSVSGNQALGMISAYKSGNKVSSGDWVRLEEGSDEVIEDPTIGEKEDQSPGTLGIVSVALFGSSSSLNTTTPSGSNRMSGNLFGIDFRVEGWITRQYFASLEIDRSLGTLSKSSGNPDKSDVSTNNGTFKLTGGYKYLPIGFFYGPQIDLYAGYANYSFDQDVSEVDGFGKNNISGLLLGTNANIPINREYRLFAQAEFIPFPSFSEDDEIYGSSKSVSSLDLEIGVKYQYTPRMTVDGSFETMSRKAKFNGAFKELSYKDNRLKLGVSFNF
ncbi:MAG: porin family protein [Bacteriovoracaceae bacterium]|nr:porin family protein [Bacteriovoracaceae bacterium]